MFLSPATMLNLQRYAEQAFTTDITILRREVTTLGETITSNDFGDDVVTYDATKANGLPRRAKGWFYSTPTPTQDEDAGSLVTTNTYRLFVPVGTDIRIGDEVTVGSEVYIVSDTTAESTWKAMLRCSLRRRE